MSNVGVVGPVPDGLVRYWCKKCGIAPADTLPGSRVVCNKGHECKPCLVCPRRYPNVAELFYCEEHDPRKGNV